AKKAIDEGYTKYTPVSGFLELRQAISRKFKRDNDLDYAPEQIVVSTGAKQAIINVMMVLLNTGDEVILPSPYWVSYREMVKIAEGNFVVIQTKLENEFKITPDELRAAITPRTKLFVFSSPCNPTGEVYSKDELNALVAVFEQHPNVYIVSDEIYEYINFSDNHHSIAQFESVRDRVIVVNGVSKGHAMTGWRIGYIAAKPEIAKACDKMQGQFTSGTSAVSQRAALAALEGPLDETHLMVTEYKKRRDLVMSMLAEIPGIKPNHPEGAFYVFPDVSHYFGRSYNGTVIKNADDLCMYWLNEFHVAIVTGSAFGDSNCVRISYATSVEKLKEAMKRVKEACSKLT
ncbi:MAG TPA: pyridoxal phosphate-dependent aminotransferase, partial [Chitinophagales bacterium]|nr:pyridoxal phosphate-dependent aminotransferase [Chitinophagales bacterium]